MTSERTIRWWPAVLIALGALGVLVWTWMGETVDRQSRVTQTAFVLLVAGFLLVLWALLLSRLPGQRRLQIAGALVVALALAATLFRIEGVSGDLVPILGWRFGGDADLAREVAGSAPVSTSPDDSPQFLGPRRNGVLAAARLARDWQATPPRELWRIPVGKGWSGFAVVGDAAVTQEQRGGDHAVVRYDLETGETVWVASEPESFESPIGGDGPRGTPAVAGGHVYTFGPQGVLRVHDLEDGTLLWRRDVKAALDLATPDWGFSASPLLVDNLVVVAAGGEGGPNLAAYRRDDGELAWSAGTDRPGYSSPTLATLDGVPQILAFNGGSLSSHDPADGDVLWSVDWPNQQPNVALPIVFPSLDRVMISTGYGVGSALFEVRRADDQADDQADDATWRVDEIWRNNRLKAKFTNPVVYDGTVYGLDDGILVALDPETGDRHWKRGRYGHGQTLLAGDLLVVQTEDGSIVLVDATPEEFRELATLDALDGKSWNPPTLAGSTLLVRNATEAVAYELPTG